MSWIDDPWADPEEVAQEYDGLELVEITPKTQVDALIVAVSHDQFTELTPRQLHALLRGVKPVLADVKSLYNASDLEVLNMTVWKL